MSENHSRWSVDGTKLLRVKIIDYQRGDIHKSEFSLHWCTNSHIHIHSLFVFSFKR